MNRPSLLFLSTVVTLLASSCSTSTEKYAQKEHGKKFDSWELNYRANDYDVYWPTLKLADQPEGELFNVTTERHWWTGQILRRDTTVTGALLKITINNVKSRNDAKYYDNVLIKVSDLESNYRSGLEHRFVFNEGQKDSVSFATKSNDDHYFVPGREVSGKIVSLLVGEKPIDLKVSYKASSVEGFYTFTINGSPKLEKGLALNHERKLQAQKEFEKADRKAEKELEELFN